ncbi:MAG: phosphopyruvate hydratase [Methanospirillaceae archaeon]|nr:phosphopyruvate hydratase [Methanospirillaceae archaeon]
MNSTITTIHAREILDSRGNPTVEVDLCTSAGTRARAACPSGASTGIHEAVELRDNDNTRFLGKGVRNAVSNIQDRIAPLLSGMDVSDQEGIDKALIEQDGTKNKGNLGANAILTISMAVARAAAADAKVPLWKFLGKGPYLLPVPCMNVINGGAHANWQGADFQEYMIAPVGATSFGEALRWGCETYQTLKGVLKKKGASVGVGDEGGFAPVVSSNEEPLILIISAIEEAGYTPGTDIGIALDPASSEFFSDGKYRLLTEKSDLSSGEMIDRYADLVRSYPILSIEDGLGQDDWEGWKELTARIGKNVQIVGDDLFVTNALRIQKGIKDHSANAVLIKLNQIGTVTETIQAVRMAQDAHWKAMVSHRSGETSDSFIADLSVALGTGQIKSGAPCRGERVEKYNQLLRIEEDLGSESRYAGRSAF